MGNLGLTNWKLTLQQDDDPLRWPQGYLTPPDQLPAFQTQFQDQNQVIDVSIFSTRLGGKISFKDDFALATCPISLDRENLRPGQVVEVYSDGRVETPRG